MAEDTSGIFKQSWKLNDSKSNFEAALCKEVLYLKKVDQEFEKITNQARLPNSELSQERLLYTSNIPCVTGATNHGLIL